MRLKNFQARDAQLTLGRISFYLNRSGLTWNKPGNKPLYMQIILKPPQGGFLRFGLSGPIGVPESTGSLGRHCCIHAAKRRVGCPLWLRAANQTHGRTRC